MTATRIQASPTRREILANLDERTITVLLLPFGEVGQTNAGPVLVEAGHVALPPAPSLCVMNLDHKREKGVANATEVWQEPTGIMATFAFADTEEGRAAFADATDPNGTRRAVSGEFDVILAEYDPTIRARRSLPGGNLFGAGLVPRGAFGSARVLAEAVTDTSESSSQYVTEYTDADGTTWRRVEETVTTVTTTETPADETADEDKTETEGEATVPEATTVQAAHRGGVPATALPGGTAPAGKTLARVPSTATIFAAIATVRDRTRSAADRTEATTILAALQDIVPEGDNAFTADGVVQPSWVGQIAEGVPYVREYITLHNLGNDISLGGKKGYKVRRGTKAAPVDHFDGTWAGNKTTVKSYRGFTSTHESTRENFAIAEDIAREFRDLPGGTEAVAAFMNLIVEDALVWSDEVALRNIIATSGAPILPAVERYSTKYPQAAGMLIQGILHSRRRKADGRRDTPTYAIANDEAYEELAYAAGGEENLPAFVELVMSTDGTGRADGKVQVVQGDTGIEGSPSVIVGADYAIDFDELPGGPLRIDALDIARGGIDEAVHGYVQTFVKRPEAVVRIGDAADLVEPLDDDAA